MTDFWLIVRPERLVAFGTISFSRSTEVSMDVFRRCAITTGIPHTRTARRDEDIPTGDDRSRQ